MCNKCNDTGYVGEFEGEDFIGEDICLCPAGKALCGGTIVDGRQGQGNDSLGLGTPDPSVVGGRDLPFNTNYYVCCGKDMEPTDTEGHSYQCSTCGTSKSIS